MPTRFDAIVIGSGQGGGPLAHRLADAGRSVALVEQKHLGGTCVNTGCTPTKTMVASAQVAHYVRNSLRWGVRARDISVDLLTVRDRKDRIVKSFRDGQQKRVDERPSLQLFRGKGQFTGPHKVQVNGETLEGGRIFINTGTRPKIPPIPGLESSEYLTNETIMELAHVPEHLIVLGGGYIGLEFGQMFRRFGSEVTILHHSRQILPREDEEIARELQKALEAEGIRFYLDAEAERVSRTGNGVKLQLGNGESLSGSHLLVATGRVPNTEDLNLQAAGVETDRGGYIRVNEKLETTAEDIWAIGDVKGGPAFTHISYNDFQIVYGNLAGGENRTTKDRIVPYAVFTDPQLGRVGMTEREAAAAGHRLKTGSVPLSSVARAMERDETAGLMKLVVDAESDRILGAAILSAEGGELVQILHVLMLSKQPYTLLKGAIYIHPTLAEGFFALMESVKDPTTAGSA